MVNQPRQDDAAAQELSPTDVRKTMGSFATGVAVVTTEHDGELHGMTLNSLTSVSLTPPLLLVCLTNDSRTAVAVQSQGEFVVNILCKRQEWLSDRFSRPGKDHFDGVDVDYSTRGLPELPGSLASIECLTSEIVPGGDHIVVLGRIVGAKVREGTPLTFFRGRYHQTQDMGHDVPWFW